MDIKHQLTVVKTLGWVGVGGRCVLDQMRVMIVGSLLITYMYAAIMIDGESGKIARLV